MPLSKEKQAEYMREHRKQLGITALDVIPSVIPSTPKDSVIPKLEKVGLIVQGNRISLPDKPVVKQASSLAAVPAYLVTPIYDYTTAKAGDTVRMFIDGHWQTMVVPDLDADGHPIGSRSTGQLVSCNIERPAFNPVPKPEKKRKRW